MTTEPKFIPQQAAEIRLSDFKTEEEPLKLRVRLIDCVGFLADGAVRDNEWKGKWKQEMGKEHRGPRTTEIPDLRRQHRSEPRRSSETMRRSAL